ncbi:MAG TPA: PHP domain-containing protein [Armatimonadota bacterium]|nr:PHP domain-containing protein [Armatimonadota bacterium]
MSKADLHIHTVASDGLLSPTQVVEEAKRLGLSAIAITDHDTVSGIDEAITAGKRLGVRVVPAVEINTDYGTHEVHILGYFIDWHSEKLAGQLQQLRKARLDRGRKMVEKLQALGIQVKLERVLEIASHGSIGRPHLAQAVCEIGAAENMSDAFNKFLVRGAPAYVERTKLTPFVAVTIIADAGGVAGLAHPGQVGHDDLIINLVKVGLGAIEVYYGDQDPAITKHYRNTARKFGLIATGGSDAHGRSPDGGSGIGNVTVNESVVDELQAASRFHL